MDSRFLLSSYTIRDGDAHISLLFPAHFLRLVTIHGPVNSNCVCPLCGKVYLLQKGMALYTFKHSVPYLYSNRNKKKVTSFYKFPPFSYTKCCISSLYFVGDFPVCFLNAREK